MERDEGLTPKGVCDVGIKREGVERDEGLTPKGVCDVGIKMRRVAHLALALELGTRTMEPGAAPRGTGDSLLLRLRPPLLCLMGRGEALLCPRPPALDLAREELLAAAAARPRRGGGSASASEVSPPRLRLRLRLRLRRPCDADGRRSPALDLAREELLVSLCFSR